MADDPVEALLRKAGDTATIDPVDALLAKAEGGAPAAMPDVSHLGPSTRANQEATQRAEARRTAGSGFGNLAGSGMYEAQPVNREDLLTGRRPLTQSVQMDPVTMTALATADAVERTGRRIVQGVTEPIRHAAEVDTVAGWIEGASGAAFGALMASNPAGVLFSVSGAAHEAAAEGEAQGVGNDSILGRVVAAPHEAIEAGMGLLPDFEKQAEESRAIRMHPRADAETRLEASMTENLSRFGSMGKNALVIALFGAAHKAAPRVGGSILDAVTLRGQAKPGVPQGGVYGDAVPRTPHIADTPHSPIGVLESPNAAPVDAVGTRPSRAFPNRTTASLAEGQIPGPVPEGGRTVPVSQPEPPSAGLSLFTDESMTRQASPMRPRGRASRGAGEQGQQALLTPDAYASQGLKRAVEKAGFPSVLDAMRAWNEGDPLPQMKPEFIKELGKLADTYPRAGAVEYGTPRSAAARIKPSVGTEPTAPVSTPGARPLPNPDVWYEGPGGPEAFGPGVPNYPRTGEIVAPPTAGTTARPRPGTGRGFSLTTEDLMRRAAGEDQFPTTRQVDPRHDPNFRGKVQSPGVETGAPWQVDLAPGATQVGGRARFDPTTKISIEDVTPGAVTERPTGRGVVQPPAGEVSGTAPRKPAAARSEPIDLETPPTSPGAPERTTGGWGDREPTTIGVGYAVDRNIDTLKRYGKAGEDLSARVRTVRDEVRGETHRFDQELKDATSGLTKADRKLLTEHGYDLMTGKMAPPNPQVAAAIRWWNGEGTGQTVKIAEYVNESGSLVTDPGGHIKPHKINPNTPNWAPHIYKGEFLDAVGRNDPAALAIVDKMVGEGKQFRTRAEAVEGLKNYRDAELKSLNPSTERPRYIQDPPSEVLEQDFFKLARDHAYGAFRSAAEHRAFKYLDPTGAPRNVRPGGAPQGELGDLLEQIKRERGSPDAAAAEAKVLDLLGRNPVDRSSVARLQREVGEGVGAFNAIRFYTNPVSWLRNLTQAPSVYSFVGEGPFAEGALRLAKDYQAVKTRALRTGEVDALMHHAETIGLVDETIAGQAASAGRKASNAAMIPFELADRQARLLASASAEPFAKSLREGLNGSERQARIANAKLDAMDIPADMRQRLKVGEFTEADMNRFKRELVDLTNVRINRATKIPASAASGLDRNTRYQGKNFAIEQTRAFKRIAVDQLRAGNPLPALRLVGTAGPAVGYTFTKLVNALTGDSDKEVTPVDVVRNAGAGGAGGDFIASMIPDEKGRTRARQTIENWNSSQWDSFMADLGTLADKMVSPGKRRISIGDMTVVAPKDRWDALLEFLKEVAPSFEKNVKIAEKIDLEEMIK